jgi:hypothetical protein
VAANQLFSIDASFSSVRSRYLLWFALLITSYAVSLTQEKPVPIRHDPVSNGPFIMKLTNRFDVEAACDAGTRDCSLIELNGLSLHTGVDPRIHLSGAGELPVVVRDQDGRWLAVEMPDGVADGPHTLKLNNPQGEDEVMWTLKPL